MLSKLPNTTHNLLIFAVVHGSRVYESLRESRAKRVTLPLTRVLGCRALVDAVPLHALDAGDGSAVEASNAGCKGLRRADSCSASHLQRTLAV